MRILPVALSILVLLSAAPAGATEVAWTSDASPQILDRVELPEEIDALTVSADGGSLAYAVSLGGPKGSSEMFRTAGGPIESATIRGVIRDLLFLEDGRLLALVFRPAKKWEGDTYLVSWAPGAAKPERVMRVPPSSSDIDHWPARDGIVLACRNEIRTFLGPDLRSGPVFMVPGSNLALTTLGGSSFVWVGQEEGLVLVDLAAPSGREPMTVMAQQSVPAPVVELADYPDGSAALVRLADGRLFRATLDPPGFAAGGSADRIVRLAKGTGGPPIASVPRRPKASEDAPAVAEEQRETEPITEQVASVPEIEPDPGEVVPPPVVVEHVETAKPEPEAVVEERVETAKAEPEAVVEETAEPTVTEPEPVVEERTEPAKTEPKADEQAGTTPGPAGNYRLYGKITGNAGLVREIVLLGPDNILQEAVRVKPDDQGNWGIERLAPGRYRVQVDGGGDRVLVSDPRLVLVEVGDEPTEAPEIRILRAF